VSFGALVREYVESLPFTLDFQDIDSELANLSDKYGPPGGCAVLAEIDGAAVGCVAVSSFEPPAIAELKRMYVRPDARGRGLGRALGATALEAAGDLGYEIVRLDTMAEMAGAVAIYHDMGFVEIPPYRHNPSPTARFYELALHETGS
jgi:GNAT superfamily N-acetyltransferase